MAIFTVYEPPLRDDEDAVKHATRFMIVRDGFSWRAFAFGPLWMLRHRMWLVLTLYIVWIFAIVLGLKAFGLPGYVQFIAVFLTGVWIGLESGMLRRWTYLRRGWRDLGIISAPDAGEGERRFFSHWLGENAKSFSANVMPPRPYSVTAHEPSDIIGLFPQPGGSR
ncbi:MAG TPA: DUF2628 domain-containing protein [Xanthobacteraceae bacterium]|nr:DUF2628 domain-containing protein [Xanthobacteraceae bacterium]